MEDSIFIFLHLKEEDYMDFLYLTIGYFLLSVPSVVKYRLSG